MAVADLEQRAGRVHGNVERGSRDQFLVVEIARVDPRRRAADAAIRLRRRHAHAAEERPERNLDAIGESPDHALAVERNDLDPRVRKIIRQKPGAGTESVVSVRNGQPDLLDPHLQRVAGLGAFDVHGPGENMAARPFVGHLVVDGAQGWFDLRGLRRRRLRGAPGCW